MARIETWLRCDLQAMVRVQEMEGDLFSADNQANRIGVIVTDHGRDVALSGSVTGYVIRPDEATVVVLGQLDGNRAWIDLPASAYVHKGPISIVVKLGTTTIAACHGYMKRSTTDTIVDPGHVIPSISDLLSEIDNMRTATAAANTAAGSANNAASDANVAAANANNKASEANTAATKLNGMTVTSAQGEPGLPVSVTLELVDGHYQLTFTNVKGATGDAFHIVKTYDTVAQMEADYNGTDTVIGDYVMVVSTVEDPDNAKVYIKGTTGWRFVVDMSGATGMIGPKGDKGDPGDATIDDMAGSGDTTKVWSADKTYNVVMGIFNHATQYTPSNDPMFFYGEWYHEVGTSYIARLNDSHAPADPELVSVWQVMGDAPYHIPSSSNYNWLVYTFADAMEHINDFQNNIADIFYSGVVYEEGRYVTRDGVTYKRKSWGSTTPVAKAWSASDWEKVEVANDLNEKIDSECSNLKSAISRIESSNVLFSQGSVTLSGAGTYVSQELARVAIFPGETITAMFDSQSGATSAHYMLLRFYDSNGTQLSQAGSGTNNKLTFVTPANTAKVALILSAAAGTAMPTGSATFTNVLLVKGTEAVYEINPEVKYQRLDYSEENIERLETNFNDVICYNLMGTDSSVYYPVKLSPGDKVTFSKKDGSVFSSSSTLLCAFCDINKSPIINKALNTNTTEIAYTIPAGLDIRYLKWNEAPGEVMVNLGNKKPYVVYNADTLEAKLNEISDIVDESATQRNLINKENGFLEIGTMENGDKPFTKDEVSPGDIVHFNFVSPAGASIGLLRLRDVSDNNLSFYINLDNEIITSYGSFVGRDAAARPEEYSGTFIIPNNFDHCFVQCNGSYTITVKELYVNKYEDRIATERMNIPVYYFADNYLPAKATSINERLESSLAYGDAFIFITDLHLKANQKHSPALIRYLYQHTSVRKLVYGGDLMDGGLANEYPITRKYTSEMREAFPCLQMFCVGNHDTFQNNPSSRISTWADTTIDRFTGDSDKHYFYYDDNRAKIRFIVLNRYYEGDQNTSSGFYVDTVQREWFANVALDMEEGYGAVIFIHNLYNFNYTVADPVMTIDTGCEAYLSDVADAYNANPESKGEVIAIVQGHTHSDRVLRTTGGIPIVITTCDKNEQADPEQPDILFPAGVAERASETIREQAFDVIVINRKKDANNKGTIYAIRVGCEAYDGTTVSDMGSATQERVILYDEKF